MEFYYCETTVSKLDKELKKCDAHIGFGASYHPLETIKAINKIIEKAKKQGYSHIGLYESDAYGLEDLYFYFGTKGEVRKRLRRK
jgi:hypothetical protein